MMKLLGYGIYLLTLNKLLTPQPNIILVPTPSAPPPPPYTPCTAPGKKGGDTSGTSVLESVLSKRSINK